MRTIKQANLQNVYQKMVRRSIIDTNGLAKATADRSNTPLRQSANMTRSSSVLKKEYIDDQIANTKIKNETPNVSTQKRQPFSSS